MKLFEFIRNAKNKSLEEMEVLEPSYFDGVDLANFVLSDFEDISAREILWGDYIYTLAVDIEAKHIKAILREMRVRMLKPIGSIKKLRRILFSHISLLFGMCSSQSSLILNAFYGNSLSRIPSL
jgi:hypothetical protein